MGHGCWDLGPRAWAKAPYHTLVHSLTSKTSTCKFWLVRTPVSSKGVTFDMLFSLSKFSILSNTQQGSHKFPC